MSAGAGSLRLGTIVTVWGGGIFDFLRLQHQHMRRKLAISIDPEPDRESL